MTKIKISELQSIINLDRDMIDQVDDWGLWADQPQSVSDMTEDLTYNHVTDATQDQYTMGGETITEDYPESFNHEEFKKLNSFASRKKYCDQHLKRIGSGSSRIVYEIDDETILKLAYNKKGLDQNYNEIGISNSNWHEDVVTKVYDYNNDNFWIRCEKALKVSKGRFRELIGFNFDDVSKYLDDYSYRRKGKRPPYNIDLSPDLHEQISNSEFVYDIQQVVENWDITMGDFLRISSYGEVKRSGNPYIVLTDYGLTSETHSKHYVREFEGDDSHILLSENIDDINLNTTDKIIKYVAKKLNLAEPKPIKDGSGSWGYAYSTGTKVIKISRDISEATESKKLLGKKNKHIADIYNVIKIANLPNSEKEVYVIVLELLDRNPTSFKQKIDALDNFIKTEIDSSIEGIFVYEIGSNTWSETYEIIKEAFIEENETELNDFFNSMLEIYKELKLNGIQSMDFLNYLNLGYKNGNLATFDLGSPNVTTSDNDIKKIDYSEMSEDGTSLYSNRYGTDGELNENKQQFEKEFVKTGHFDDEDIKNVLDITNGDETTYHIADMYAYYTNRLPYTFNNGKKGIYNKNEKDLFVRTHRLLKNYKDNKNLFPIEGFDILSTKEHITDIVDALESRNYAITTFKRIPEKYRRNLKKIYRTSIPITNYRFNDNVNKDNLRTINNFLTQLEEMNSEEKKEILLNKVFSSKNDTMEKIIHHIENARPTYLNHDNEKEAFMEMVEYEESYDEAKVLHNDGDVVVVDVKSSDAMKNLGCGGQWCFTTESGTEHWANYARDSHVNLIINFSEDSDSYERMIVALPNGDGIYNMYNEYMEDGWNYLSNLGVLDSLNIDNEDIDESNVILDESIQILERIISWMPKVQAVTVKKECTLGGNGDGTSKACNQGDINSIELKDIKDDNYKKPNEPNVAEENIKNRHYFKNIDRIIKEEIKIHENSLNYNKWKRENVSYRGIKDIYDNDGENGGGAMLGQGLYSVPASNKKMAREYGELHILVNAIPKKPKIVNTLNDWEIWFQNNVVFPISKAKGKDYPDGRDVTSITDEMKKLGYDGVIIKGREIVSYEPKDVIYFKNERQLEMYYENQVELGLIKEEIESIELNELNTSNLNLPPFKIIDNKLVLNGKVVGNVFIDERRYGDENHIELTQIVVNEDQRGNYIFTRFMNALIKYANNNNKIISLTPERIGDSGLSTNRLKEKYKSFGFIKNLGSNRNFMVKNSYIKYPKGGLDENLIKEESPSNGDSKVEFGCLMLEFEIPKWNKLINRIKEEDLYDDGSDTFGREDEAHVTILYGYHDNVNADDVFNVLGDIPKTIQVTATGISLFENKERGFDVVKIDIEPSVDLKMLRKNAESETLDKTLTYRDYKPHMTLAYVKSGMGKKYTLDFDKPIKLVAKSIYYSDKSRGKKYIQLDGKDKKS